MASDGPRFPVDDFQASRDGVFRKSFLDARSGGVAKTPGQVGPCSSILVQPKKGCTQGLSTLRREEEAVDTILDQSPVRLDVSGYTGQSQCHGLQEGI